MIILTNGCTRSEISVTPKNWNTAKASMKKKWRIYYRFYDPAFRSDPRFKTGKMVCIRGMNNCHRLQERQALTESLIYQETDMLDNQGYNPISRTIVPPVMVDYIIAPETGFILALRAIAKSMKVETATKANLFSVIKYSELAAKDLRINMLPVFEIRKRHMKSLLETLPSVKKTFTANTFNHYWAHLSMMFTELVECEAVEMNPVLAIKKMKYAPPIRQTLTIDERKTISDKLQHNPDTYNFWRFIQIFFHSGCREKELMRIHRSDLDIAGQRFQVTILKGKNFRKEWRPIKDIVLPFWKELASSAKDTDFLFSRNLKPGKKALQAERVTRLWERHVKKGMGIKADLYSLKHSNLDETAAALDIIDAARMAGHTTPVITMKVYATGEKERQDDRLRKVSNPFG